MAHHGHKIEEREHALIKALSITNSWGAQGLKLLCLSVITLMLMGLFFKAHAQVYSTNPPVSNTGNAAQLEIRLQQLETQIRDLTGKVEQQTYTINSLNNQIKMMKDTQASAIKPSAGSSGASQIATPTRQGNAGSPIMPMDFKPPALTGIQTTAPQNSGGQQDATAQYETAYTLLKSRDYVTAQQGFQDFLKNNNDHVLAANAKYWLGETYYVQGEYKNAARHFAEGFQTFPESSKSPDMLLKLGMSLDGMGKTKDACVALSQLPVKFPVGYDAIIDRSAQEMEKLGCGS